MSDSSNIAVVRRLYEARGAPEIIRQVLARDVRWEVVDGFPYGAVYVGLDSVLGDFFGRLFTDFGEFVANGSEFFESGERVIALGNYSGRARRSGKRFTARFAHVWTLQDGLIVRLQQCADTVQLPRALADETETTVEARRGADALKRAAHVEEFTMIVEYIRYRLPSEQCIEFERAYGLAGEPLLASPHCLAYELTRCTE